MSEDKASHEENAFKLGGVDGSFNNRSLDVFSVLDTLEAKHEAYRKTQPSDEYDHYDSDEEIVDAPKITTASSSAPAQDSSFKVPCGLAPQSKSRKSIKNKDSSNWTHYDLSDVDTSSEGGNAAAAMEFLQSRKVGLSEEDKVESTNHEQGSRHVFKKPRLSTTESVVRNEKESPKSSEVQLLHVDALVSIEEEGAVKSDTYVKGKDSFSTPSPSQKKTRHFRRKEEGSDEEEEGIDQLSVPADTPEEGEEKLKTEVDDAGSWPSSDEADEEDVSDGLS